ncbi:deoxycytidylate deaminase [Desulfomicrobium escambiense]|uniref:deoxycytidylate deaminase n=1 Tax=Desulfomicrobium escambiense TaxID=29503 RepID=UPI0004193018|nr:cytidine/deoxycytidylate deaminase family protein [Desulfomicrobium escambiense]
MDNRIPWPQYFMNIAYLVAERSTCLRRKVGALAVKDKRILATGYNGAPAGLTHCLEIGCLREKLGIPSGQRHELCRALHAEQNVIIQAAIHGVSIEGADIFCTTQPCILCAKMLINCRVRAIHFAEGYPDDMSREMLDEAGIPYHRMERETDGR